MSEDVTGSLQKALAWLQCGRAGDAAEVCERLLDQLPDDPRVLEVYGAALEATGGHEAAAEAFLRLTQLEPTCPRHWENLGTCLRSAGHYDPALTAYERAHTLGLSSTSFHLNFALLRIDRLEFAEAQRLLAAAMADAPENAAIRVFLAVASFEQADDESARTALAELEDIDDLDDALLGRAAAILMQVGRHDHAERLLLMQQSRSPNDRHAAVRLAQVLERTNRVQEAKRVLESIPRFPPPEGELADDLLSINARLHERGGDWLEAADGYRTLLNSTTAPHLEYHVRYPLARALDAAGDHDSAHAEFGRAHESQTAFLERSSAHLLHPDRRAFSIADFPSDPVDIAGWDHEGAPDVGASPLFVVGFPRSGTTLLEQMLDAHPMLSAMDEQPFLQNAIDALRGMQLQYPDGLANAARAQLDAVRADYVRRANQIAGPLLPGCRRVDKNPLNLLRLPAIARLFPNARVLLIVRHPCDVILSCYQQHFRAPEFASLCRDLGTLAHAYVRAFDFWFAEAAKLRPQVLEVRYESFVQNFEDHARAIARFLDLPWDEAMLDPARRARDRGYISTPSYAQVTQPVTSRAVGRWSPYRRHFEPVLPILAPYLDRWGYAT